jgi:transcription initiation factor IIF auxiliary subunit
MTVQFNNYSRSVGKRGDNEYYQWRVFVDEPPEVLDQIEEVEYLLHPTFPQPSQVRYNRSDKFALDTAGWGEFQILITVKYKDGRQEREKYWLTLDPQKKPWPR